MPEGTPGKGVVTHTNAAGKRLTVINVMTNLFMAANNPVFAALDGALVRQKLGRDADFILVDAHGEATSEKMALGHMVDGRASMLVGTHTHVPTADVMILPAGSAYQSDAGMCGDYNSVIGMDKAEPLRRFITGMSKTRFTPAVGDASLCGLYVETDDASGLAKMAKAIRVGGRLAPSAP